MLGYYYVVLSKKMSTCLRFRPTLFLMTDNFSFSGDKGVTGHQKEMYGGARSCSHPTS